MKQITSAQLREMFQQFMESKGHHRIPSASVIPENAPARVVPVEEQSQAGSRFGLPIASMNAASETRCIVPPVIPSSRNVPMTIV